MVTCILTALYVAVHVGGEGWLMSAADLPDASNNHRLACVHRREAAVQLIVGFENVLVILQVVV